MLCDLNIHHRFSGYCHHHHHHHHHPVYNHNRPKNFDMVHGLKIKMYEMFHSVILQNEFYEKDIDFKPQALEILSIDRLDSVNKDGGQRF